MDIYNILPVNKPANFKHTLDHLAREWYDSLTFPIAWNDLQQWFSRYFSTQGRSIKHLHDKWRNFSFTPGQDDIEAYIRDVKEAAHQLNYNDEAILHLIKAMMPSEIYSTLYNQNDLNTVITMVKDIYAKKPEAANPHQLQEEQMPPLLSSRLPMVLTKESISRVMNPCLIE